MDETFNESQTTIMVTIDIRSQEAGDLIPWSSHIEHDVANEVIVEGESCLENGYWNYYQGTKNILMLSKVLLYST